MFTVFILYREQGCIVGILHCLLRTNWHSSINNYSIPRSQQTFFNDEARILQTLWLSGDCFCFADKSYLMEFCSEQGFQRRVLQFELGNQNLLSFWWRLCTSLCAKKENFLATALYKLCLWSPDALAVFVSMSPTLIYMYILL